MVKEKKVGKGSEDFNFGEYRGNVVSLRLGNYCGMLEKEIRGLKEVIKKYENKYGKKFS